MKKIVLVLAMLLALSLCVNASAASFGFTAEEYKDAYSYLVEESLEIPITWSDAVDTDDGMTGWAGQGTGMADAYVYTNIGEADCIGMVAMLNVGLTDSNLSDMSAAFGQTVACIPFTARYIDLDYDNEAFVADISTMETACTSLIEKAFSEDALTAAMSGPYTETAEIAGHNASVTVEIDIASMTLNVTFIFMP